MTTLVLTLVLAKWAAQLWLEKLNQSHVLAHAGTVPGPLKNSIDPATYFKSVEYTLAKSRFGTREDTWNSIVLLAVLFSGALSSGYDLFANRFGASAWTQSAFLFIVGVVLSLAGLPFDWHAQFRLEERFGFNTTTRTTWCMDRIKGLLLALALGYPLLTLILKLVEWMGDRWWLWAWAGVLGFQLLMVVLAPILILPMFNKFTPLPEGSLRERLLALGKRTGFTARTIQVMDGSKRSRHANAFFTGFGQFRKVVLFDTLIQQLAEPELEAVLAHEIGHYKKRHVPKMLAWLAASLFIGFYGVAWIAKQAWFYQAFGFGTGTVSPALLLAGLLGGVVTFWFSPLQNLWSRRFEYQADAFAAETMGQFAVVGWSLAQVEREESEQPHPAPALQRFLLFAPDASGTRTGPGFSTAGWPPHCGLTSKDQGTIMTQFCEPKEFGTCIEQFGSSLQCPSTR